RKFAAGQGRQFVWIHFEQRGAARVEVARTLAANARQCLFTSDGLGFSHQPHARQRTRVAQDKRLALFIDRLPCIGVRSGRRAQRGREVCVSDDEGGVQYIEYVRAGREKGKGGGAAPPRRLHRTEPRAAQGLTVASEEWRAVAPPTSPPQ